MASIQQMVNNGVDQHQRRDGKLMRRREQDVAKLWSNHHEILRRSLIGQKPKLIAEELGVCKQTVINVLNSPIAQSKLSLMQADLDLQAVDVAERISETAPKAVEVLSEMLDSEQETMRFRAATDLLDRAGFTPVKKVDARVLSGKVSSETLEKIFARAKQQQTESASAVVDVQTQSA